VIQFGYRASSSAVRSRKGWKADIDSGTPADWAQGKEAHEARLITGTSGTRAPARPLTDISDYEGRSNGWS
jgi:hypothetical protein